MLPLLLRCLALRQNQQPMHSGAFPPAVAARMEPRRRRWPNRVAPVFEVVSFARSPPVRMPAGLIDLSESAAVAGQMRIISVLLAGVLCVRDYFLCGQNRLLKRVCFKIT